MQVEMVDPRYGEGSTFTTTPKAQRIADAIVFTEFQLGHTDDTFTVYELVHKYGLADILGSYSYTGRTPINVADQVIRNAINNHVKCGELEATAERRKGYVVYRVVW